MHAGLTLLSDTAIFVGGTAEPTPPATFAQTAADLFPRSRGFDLDDHWAVCVIGTDGWDAPLQVFTTPAIIQ